MNRGPLAAFLAAPSMRRRLALEAARELVRARLLTMRSATVYSPALGRLVGEAVPEPVSIETQTASEIGHVVSRVAALMPFRARCLQQAIAVRRMLARRGIPAMVYLGVARDRGDRCQPDRAAHAWVRVGEQVISGDGVIDNFAIVARFA